MTENSCLELQNDLAKRHEWSQQWQMESNVEKCHVMRFGKSSMRPDFEYQLGNDGLQESEIEQKKSGSS